MDKGDGVRPLSPTFQELFGTGLPTPSPTSFAIVTVRAGIIITCKWVAGRTRIRLFGPLMFPTAFRTKREIHPILIPQQLCPNGNPRMPHAICTAFNPLVPEVSRLL